MTPNPLLIEMGKRAKAASFFLAGLSVNEKNEMLKKMGEALVLHTPEILKSNAKDLEEAEAKGISGAMLDRLMLNERRIQDMVHGIQTIIALPDPVGEVLSMWKRPNGLMVGQKRVPLGVIGIVYEARPNVTVDAAALCLKTGNAVILRGGSEAIHSNLALVFVLQRVMETMGFPEGCLQILEDTKRETAEELMRLDGYIDVLIPRGGAGLIQKVKTSATIPVIETGVGNCHIYVDQYADLAMASAIILNAKTSRPSVCNAVETVLIDEKIAQNYIPMLFSSLLDRQVSILCCEQALAYFGRTHAGVSAAKEEDWATEFLDLKLAVKVVPHLDAAISHIHHYGTGHSEAIITNNYLHSQRFIETVDAAAVYINASTRFTDGFEFGFGAEIGISTQKLHARGPMGLEALTTYKYIIYGQGQIR